MYQFKTGMDRYEKSYELSQLLKLDLELERFQILRFIHLLQPIICGLLIIY